MHAAHKFKHEADTSYLVVRHCPGHLAHTDSINLTGFLLLVDYCSTLCVFDKKHNLSDFSLNGKSRESFK